MAIRSWIRGVLVGAGAFGKVNLALNRENGEVFAVKSVQLGASDAGDKVCLNAIENEINLLQSLDSKYVVRCLGSDWTEESGKITRNVFLEYMPEGSLTDFLKQFTGAQMLDEHLIRTFTRSIVHGIDYLHKNGIVHCDIKGANVLVGNGNVKLIDFGSAKRLGENHGEEVVNEFAKVNGTPRWMAPEVVRQVEQGTASDIWSLGCTVLEMATGKPPWSDLANPFVALYHIGCTDELPSVPSSLSAEAHDFLSHCFQRDPRKRWTSAELLQHPFLTTQYVESPLKPVSPLQAPLSPISVMRFPSSDSSSGVSSAFEDSIPVLSTPPFPRCGSLWERPREKISVEAQEQNELSNGWGSSPRSPTAGQWIVVRSPKGSPPCPFSPFSDFMAPVVDDLVCVSGASIVIDKIEAPPNVSTVAAGTSADKMIIGSSTRDRHSCPDNDFSVKGRSFVNSSIHHASSELFPLDFCATGTLNLHAEVTEFVFPAKSSDIYSPVKDSRSRASKNDHSISRLHRSVPVEGEFKPPIIGDGLSNYFHEIQSSFESSQFRSCQFPSKQSILFAWHALFWRERYKFVGLPRNQTHWNSIDYVHFEYGPRDLICTTQLHVNEMTPWVMMFTKPDVSLLFNHVCTLSESLMDAQNTIFV